MTTFDCPNCHGHWAEGVTRDHCYTQLCRKCLEKEIATLTKKGHVMDLPICEDSGVVAINGTCPEHGGDACLIRPLATARELKAERGDLMRAKCLLVQSMKTIMGNASSHMATGGLWYYTEANAALRAVEDLTVPCPGCKEA